MALIFWTEGQIDHICGGSIINKKYILTAAHCLYKQKLESMTIRVGSNTRRSGGTTYTADLGVIHKDYNAATLINDIGLLRVSKNIVMTNFVTTMTMSTSNIGAGKRLTAIGWGSTESSRGGFADKLRKTSVLSISVSDCQKAYKNSGSPIGDAVWDDQLCTNVTGSKGICQGDSGGPLISSDNKQVGLASFGVKPCGSGLPNVFTRISEYSDWIKASSKV